MLRSKFACHFLADMDNGEIYKMELDGKILGKFGSAGKQLKEFGSVHEIDCRNPSEVYVGELTNWRVQKLTLHPQRGRIRKMRALSRVRRASWLIAPAFVFFRGEFAAHFRDL
jgi:hypothetical protein